MGDAMGFDYAYAGISLSFNQVGPTANPIQHRLGYKWYFQEFFIPDDYVRGEGEEALIPEMRGFQIKAKIRSGYTHAAALDYSISYKTGTENEWQTLAMGTQIGASEEGDEVWFSIVFDEPVVVTQEMLDKPFRLGVRGRDDDNSPDHVEVRCKLDKAKRRFWWDGRWWPLAFTWGRYYYPFFWNDWPCHIRWHHDWDDYCYFYVDRGVDFIYLSDGGGLDHVPYIGRCHERMDEDFDLAYEALYASLDDYYSPWYDIVVPYYRGKSYWNYLQWSYYYNRNHWRWYRPLRVDGQRGYDPINGISNPSVEINSVGHEATGTGTVESFARSRDAVRSGRWSMKLVGDATGVDSFTAFTTAAISPAAKEGDEVFFRGSINVAQANPGGSVSLVARWLDENGALLSQTTVATINNPSLGAWQDLAGAAQAPANTAYAAEGITFSGQDHADTTFYTDAYMVVVDPDPDSAYATPAYFDGDTLLGRWLGPPHAAPSQKYTPGVSFFFRLLTQTLDTGTDPLGNTVRYVSRRHKVDDVDTYNGPTDEYWLSKPNPSKFAVEALYMDIADEEGAPSVVDHVLLDPMTPDVYFNIYYSNEDFPDNLEADPNAWDEKLWMRVPRIYQARKRDTYALPQPIAAKYIKVEFTHLQAQTLEDYVDMGLPVRYKKHPKWVLDYFLARLEARRATEDEFVADRVAVTYDQYDLAYDYYLDDIGERPDTPAPPKLPDKARLNTFLAERTDASDRVSAETLQRINVAFRPYQQRPGTGVGSGILGDWVRATVYNGDYPVEREDQYLAADPSQVSTTRQDAVVFEHNMPIMYFFIPARHRYREVEATLDGKIGYFAGVREIAFFREHYTKESDTPAYTEVGGDRVNIERNDFVSSDGFFVTS